MYASFTLFLRLRKSNDFSCCDHDQHNGPAELEPARRILYAMYTDVMKKKCIDACGVLTVICGLNMCIYIKNAKTKRN